MVCFLFWSWGIVMLVQYLTLVKMNRRICKKGSLANIGAIFPGKKPKMERAKKREK